MQTVLAVSGRIGAGKSSLAAELAEQLSCPRASFGEYVRVEARQRGLNDGDREVLQRLGAELIETLGWENFCRQTLSHAGISLSTTPCVVEGIRHVAAVETLRSIFAPTPVRLVHVSLPEELRSARLAANGVDQAQVRAWDQHSTERDAQDALPTIADLVVSSDDPAVSTVRDWLTTTDEGR